LLELIFQGFLEWAYGLVLECWEYFSTALLDIMSMDFAYLKSHVPVMDDIMQVLMAVGWALLIGNLVFQALKSMASGLGFEGEDPKLLFTRTFVFSFLLLASPQICGIGLGLTAKIIGLLQIPTAVHVTLVDESVFGHLAASWLLVILFGVIVMFKVFRLLLEIAERYVILAVLTMTAPLAFAMGGSKSTSDIFSGWCRMFGSMCVLMTTHVIFFKMLLSVLATVPSGLDVLPWIVLLLTIVKVARKADAIITRIGLNPAITGDSRENAARRADLHDRALGDLTHYQDHRANRRQRRQGRLLWRITERHRPAHRRAVRRAKRRGQLLSARMAECAADIRPAGLFRAEQGRSNGQRTFSRAGTQRIHRGTKCLHGPAGVLQ